MADRTDALVQKISQKVGCPLPCMGREETKRLYAEIVAVAESAIREQVAKDIEAEIQPPMKSALPDFAGAGMQLAARIARGES
jgi:hypothetical protein